MSPQAKGGRRGFGSLRRLPSKRWQAKYVGPDLATHNAPKTFTTKERGQGWLADELELIDRNIWTPPATRFAAPEPTPPPRPADSHTAPLLVPYAKKVIATRVSRTGKPIAARTKDSYQFLLDKHIAPFPVPEFGTLGTTPIDKITPEMIRDWYASVKSLKTTRQPGKKTVTHRDVPTIRARAYEVIRMVLNVALDDELIPRNPCRIKGGSAVKTARTTTVLTVDEIHQLAEAMPPELGASILLSAWCALRPSELFALRRQHLVADCSVLQVRKAAKYRNGVITIGEPKWDSTGDVIIPEHIRPAIRRHLAEHVALEPDALLFPDPDRADVMREWIYRSIFDRACRTIGRPGFCPGEQRHTGATVAAQAGGTLAELMERLRHKTPQAAMHYQKVASGRSEALAAKMSELANTGNHHPQRFDQPTTHPSA